MQNIAETGSLCITYLYASFKYISALKLALNRIVKSKLELIGTELKYPGL